MSCIVCGHIIVYVMQLTVKSPSYRLCDRWGNDLQRCQEHLDAEYRKLDNDQYKQKHLYADRYMVVSQRHDVLQLKKVTSELPGARTDWRKKFGFECKVPILFLDDPSVSDDSMETMFLCGEREESMLDLKIVKKHEHGVRQTVVTKTRLIEEL